MKNEERIVEILAESLKRQDILIEEFKGVRGNIQKVEDSIQEMRGDIQEMKNNIKQVVSAVDALADIVKIALDRTNDIDSIKQRLSRLERHSGLE